MDLLKKLEAVLDVRNGVLKVNGEELPFHEDRENVVRLLITCDATIPGHSEKMLMISLDGYTREGGLRMVEDMNDKELLIAKAHVTVGDVVPVRVMNVSSCIVDMLYNFN